MRKDNLLICIPSPRDIADFKKTIDRIPYDKLWAKYYHEPEAYSRLRDFFLDHKKYDYMVIVPDDLIVPDYAFEVLVDDLYEVPSISVLSGFCNLDWQRRNMYTPRKTWGTDVSDYFVTEEYLAYHRVWDPIKWVKSAAFACMFIHRKVVQKIPFVDGHMNTFERECERLKVQIWVDLRAKMLHLANRLGNMNFEEFYLNRKPSTTIYDKWKEPNMK